MLFHLYLLFISTILIKVPINNTFLLLFDDVDASYIFITKNCHYFIIMNK